MKKIDPPRTRAAADALARQWAEGSIAPEDVDERVKEWKLDQAVREAIKTGDLHQKQFVEEVNRRRDAGRFGYETPTFVDRFPITRKKEG